MNKKFLVLLAVLLLLVTAWTVNAAFDGVRPTDNELLANTPALLRANFNALKSWIDDLYAVKANSSSVYTRSQIDTDFSTTGSVSLKADAANVYTKTQVDTFLLDKSDTGSVYTKTAADALFATLSALAAKADQATTYTKTVVDLLLTDKADTGAVALKADALSVYTRTEIGLFLADKANTGEVAAKADSSSLTSHVNNKGTHGHNDPSGQPSNRIEVTDGAGGWMFTSVAAAGGGVTNAVDLNSSTAAFSRLMNGLASNVQTALEQIDANAAKTSEVAAVDVKTDSTEIAFLSFKSATQTTDDSQNAALNARKIQADAADEAINNRSTTAAMNAAIASATLECQAKTWTPLVMANGDYTGEVIIDTVAASQTVYNVVYSSSSGWAAAKADADSTLPALGMALETGTGNKKILLRGIVKNTSWSFTKGALIYISTETAGAITTTKPSSTGNRVQIIGIAISADTIFFNPVALWIKI